MTRTTLQFVLAGAVGCFVAACSQGGVQNCHESSTGAGVVCVDSNTGAVSTESRDVDGDKKADPFVCAKPGKDKDHDKSDAGTASRDGGSGKGKGDGKGGGHDGRGDDDDDDNDHHSGSGSKKGGHSDDDDCKSDGGSKKHDDDDHKSDGGHKEKCAANPGPTTDTDGDGIPDLQDCDCVKGGGTDGGTQPVPFDAGIIL